MLMNIRSPHFQQGGTGITNFVREDLPRYEEAIRRHADVRYVVSEHSISNYLASLYSLHYLGVPFVKDCSPFWRVYDQVQAEEAEKQRPIAIELTRAQAAALMSVLRNIGGNPELTGRGYTDQVHHMLRDAGIADRTSHEFRREYGVTGLHFTS